MTNREWAHKMGLDIVPFQAYQYHDAILQAGMEIIGEETLGSLSAYTAQIMTPRGALKIACGTNGTARLDKPNGTHRWVYEKTPNQIRALIKQTLDFYKA